MEGIRLSSNFDELINLKQSFPEKASETTTIKFKLLELYCLYQITSILSEKIDISAATRVAKRIFQKTFPIDHYSFFLIDDKGQDIYLKSWFGFRRNQNSPKKYALDENIFGAALQKGRPIYIKNLQKRSARFKFYPEVRNRAGSFLCLPLISDSSNEPVGAINLYRKETDGFSVQEIRLFQKLSQQIARVIDKVLIYQHTRELSITDDLTQIANRRYFNQRFDREMQRSQRYNRALSILMIDIDYFKSYNDSHGHLKGDEVLREVAKILERSLRKADIVARFGGEEFVVLLPEIDKEHAQNVGEKLRAAVASHAFPHGESQPLGKVTISIGLASYPEDATIADTLLETADRMLYLAKSLGRNQVSFISDQNGSGNQPKRSLKFSQASSR